MITTNVQCYYLHTMLVTDKLETGRPSLIQCDYILDAVRAWENVNESICTTEGEFIDACDDYMAAHDGLRIVLALTHQETDEIISDAKYILDTMKGYAE